LAEYAFAQHAYSTYPLRRGTAAENTAKELNRTAMPGSKLVADLLKKSEVKSDPRL
jgi:hypothetical protein